MGSTPIEGTKIKNMATKIKDTPTLVGKEVKEFLKALENPKKESKETIEKMKENYEVFKELEKSSLETLSKEQPVFIEKPVGTSVKVSFDFDSTLTRMDVRSYALILMRRGIEIHITTGRTPDREDNTNVFEIANKLYLPLDRIHFLCGKDKMHFFEKHNEFLWHLDDDSIEINQINSVSDTVAISVESEYYRMVCDDLLAKKGL